MTSTSPADRTFPRAGRRQWLGLTVLILPTLLVAVDINAVFLAMPKLSVALRASETQQLWIADAYGFMVAGLVITMGALGDRVGRRRLLTAAGGAFGVLSACAAYAPNAETLIASRLALGVAGAGLMPSTLGLIMTMFADGHQRRLAITIWSTSMFGGAALGPVFGGLLLDRFWWGSVFLVGAPVMGLLLVLAPLTLPETPRAESGRIDLRSVALCLVAITSTAWAVKQFAAPSTNVAEVAVALLVGLGCAADFYRRQRVSDEPMLRLELLHDRRIATLLLAMVVSGAGLAALGWLTTQYLQSVVGLSPLRAAAAFAPMGLTMAAGCMLSPLVARRMSSGSAIAAGLAGSTVGLVPALFGSGAVTLVLADSLVAFGTGPLFALGTGLVVGGVAPERAGSAAALAEVSNYLGSTVGITVFGTLAAAIYRSRVGHAGPAARESVARATHLANTAGGASGQHLLRRAHSAFGSGITVVIAAEVAVFAVVAWLCRRNIRG